MRAPSRTHRSAIEFALRNVSFTTGTLVFGQLRAENRSDSSDQLIDGNHSIIRRTVENNMMSVDLPLHSPPGAVTD